MDSLGASRKQEPFKRLRGCGFASWWSAGRADAHSRRRPFPQHRHRYLNALYKSTPAGAADPSPIARFTDVSMPGVHVKLTQQPNFCDCGLFLLHYVELFLQSVRGRGSGRVGLVLVRGCDGACVRQGAWA